MNGSQASCNAGIDRGWTTCHEVGAMNGLGVAEFHTS